MRLISNIFMMLIVLFAAALLLIFLPLPKPFPPAMSSQRNLLSAIAIGILGMILLIWFIFGLLEDVRRRGNLLDPAFDELGFDKSSYLLTGRKYFGVVKGFRVDATYHQQYRVEPAKLDIVIRSEFTVEFAVSKKRPLLYLRDCPLAKIVLPRDDIQVFSKSDEKVRELMFDYRLWDSINSLFEWDFNLMELYVTSTLMVIHIRGYDLSPSQVSQIIEDVIIICGAVKSL
ncbi:MAG: hypothetical protein ACP5G4_00890 [bacterium]